MAKGANIRFNDSGYHKSSEEDSEKNERWYPHFIGLLGEIAFSRIYKLPINLDVSSKGDTIDFGQIEVKTRCSKDRNPLLIVKEREIEKKSPSSFFLMRLDPSFEEAEVLGAVSKQDFVASASPLKLYGREVLTMRADTLKKPPVDPEAFSLSCVTSLR